MKKKNWITKEDIGKVFKRYSGSLIYYIYIKDQVCGTEYDGGYTCDFIYNNGRRHQDVWQYNIDSYEYEEVSKLEVLVVSGVVI